MGNLTRYFDLASWSRAKDARSDPTKRPAVLPQYLALALGVFAEPLIKRYAAEQTFGLDWQSAGPAVLFGLLIALAIFPAVYRNAFDPERPLFVQLCAIFASGIGWQSLFQAGTTAATR